MYFFIEAIVSIAALVAAFWVPVKENCVENRLDKAGRITNIILAVLYIPITYIGIFSTMVSDAPNDGIEKILVSIIASIGMNMLLFSAISIAASVALRKRGHGVFSFSVQFLALILFIIMMAALIFVWL